jgi:hypothetical protein
MSSVALLDAAKPFVELNRELEKLYSNYPDHSILFGCGSAFISHGNVRQVEKAFRDSGNFGASESLAEMISSLDADLGHLRRENERLRWRHPNVIPDWNDLPDKLRNRLVEISAQYADGDTGGDFAVQFYGDMRKALSSAPPVNDPPIHD